MEKTNLDERLKALPDMPTLRDLEKATGISYNFFRIGLQRGLLPIGVALKRKNKYQYLIIKNKVLDFYGVK